MTFLGRSVLTATALLALSLPSPARALTPEAATTTSSSGTSSSGVVFWANAGVEKLAHPRSPAHRARVLLGVMRRNGATIGLLAETSAAQLRALRRAAGTSYDVVPGLPRGETNAVVFDTRAYRLERVVRFRSVTYHGRPVREAVAVLRDRATGARIGAVAVHHPASNTRRGTQGRWQRIAWRTELRVLDGLRASYDGGLSTFLGGDFNQRATCRLVARTGLVSPVGTVSSCPTARPRIDQVFADRSVTFTRYRTISRRAARATDHPGVYAAGFRLSQPS